MEIHGGDIYTAEEELQTDYVIDFSANINPFGVPASVRKAINGAVQQLVHYPDPYQRKLRHALGEFHQVHPDHIVCGNGGADVIFRLVRAVAPKKALVPVPTFSEYGKALEENGCEVQYWTMPEPFVVTEAILDELEQGSYDFLALCNPNNPTGTLIAPGLLQQILDLAKQKQVFVLLDECFYDMTEDEMGIDSMILDSGSYANLLILKSMTKLYAIPGLRLGYGICSDAELVERIRTMGQPWPVSTLASEAGCAAVEDHTYRTQFLKFLQEERDFLYDGLKSLGFRVWKPHANYIFFQVPGCYDLDRRLLTYHVLLRHCDSYVGLNAEYYRAAVRSREDNQYFLRCLRKIISKRGLY